ncbi:metallophosphoesterase [Sphingomonas sp. BIUV-7]|uniref:Metallophosphoesterase n=1 Tax=Sphingomonas natans TaxID=3063330 RepID=A0ABT8Y9W7_9SPHN|nr:metallophosphoesterase [Sphingomonas sp. BIUV-7]MDO6414777.1 metallophosphoesterase [Sphingomonas sp. BIUV-7]
MLIAQISDLHIGFERAHPDEPNLRRLNRVLDRILALDPLPDLLIASGDLTEYGDAESYTVLAKALARCPMPVHLMAGNHDLRGPLAQVFPDAPMPDGFLQHVIEGTDLRLILLDTLEEGRHGGAFCEIRAAWLAARLAEAPDRPTLVFLHHPPQSVGIPWMDPAPTEPWIARLNAAIAGHAQVIGLVSGHVHRSSHTSWSKLPLIICPSTAPEVSLVLTPIDAAHPDDRPLIEDGDPGFALHCWHGDRLTTLFGGCPPQVLASYTDKLQPMIASMLAERAG